MKDWYEIEDIEKVDSPSIILYEENLMYNLHKIVSMVNGDTSLLMPHIKTNKMPKVISAMISLGIKKFKAATISEAEIAASEGADSILIAHQLVGPKIERFCSLFRHFSNTTFSTIVDNIDSIEKLNKEARKQILKIDIYIDINSGMHRSGVEIGFELDKLIQEIPKFTSLNFGGIHVYDGHLRATDFQKRKSYIESEFRPIKVLFDTLKQAYPDIKLICGGTPSFTSHITEEHRITSPGTCVLWDWGYSEKLKEQEYKYAALLICRVISKPKRGIITIDLGHKSVGSENLINQRVKFLNLKNYELISQSEEHGILQVKNWEKIKVGDVYYGIPYHICSTINLHDDVSVISKGKKVDSWDITARKRKITF
ncbi:alanine racemase [Flavivirga aquatica]|uniref:Alanine racemase n=1 Tax=Flavivirga aquatica TaxID=1849968 RepID=A0A1E5TAX2_9FLAO|nr:alanine racemase [Flavivirga aquatica]OEK08524.1 alanine racemase [Flavivirga aquatica]